MEASTAWYDSCTLPEKWSCLTIIQMLTKVAVLEVSAIGFAPKNMYSHDIVERERIAERVIKMAPPFTARAKVV